MASRDAEWLQQAVDVISGLFACMVLITNTTKTQVMTCMPGYVSTHLSNTSYQCWKRGREEPLQAQQRQCVNCSECGKSLASSSLSQHLLTQHGQVGATSVLEAPPLLPPHEYHVSFPKHLRQIQCPVEGCPGTAKLHDGLHCHFMHCHVNDVIVILQ